MEGVIILAHGSRRQETEKTLESLISKVKAKTGLNEVVPAFLQFSGQNLETAVKMLVSKGIKNIRVVPMFLFDGVHVTMDIPEELEEIRSAYPDISIEMTGHLGDDDRIADIIADRIKGEKV